MRIHVVNPNTTTAMTAKIRRAAEAIAAPGTVILADEPAFGPASIEGHYDAAFAVPGMLARLSEAEALGVDGHVIACFDDTGLDAARAAATRPVVGIGEAAFHVATLIAEKFSVVTTLSRSIPVIEANLVRYGLATRCARVRASDVAVLALEDEASPAFERISEEIARALVDDRAEAIVLGCAGMTDLAERLGRIHAVPVIDGVAVAVTLVESLVRLRLTTSKSGGWAAPLPKIYTGAFAAYAPRVIPS